MYLRPCCHNFGFFLISPTLKTMELEEMIAIVKLTRLGDKLGFWTEQLSQKKK